MKKSRPTPFILAALLGEGDKGAYLITAIEEVR
jgi:hypothetical protein